MLLVFFEKKKNNRVQKYSLNSILFTRREKQNKLQIRNTGN